MASAAQEKQKVAEDYVPDRFGAIILPVLEQD
jgi:hypothetical protein